MRAGGRAGTRVGMCACVCTLHASVYVYFVRTKHGNVSLSQVSTSFQIWKSRHSNTVLLEQRVQMHRVHRGACLIRRCFLSWRDETKLNFPINSARRHHLLAGVSGSVEMKCLSSK